MPNPNNNLQRRPDYLVLGHVTKDLDPEGGAPTAGGTALYSALTAQRLGMQAAIVTACAPADERLLGPARDAGVWVHVAPSESTTTFLNQYDHDGRRTQHIHGTASPLSPEVVPAEWARASIVHLGPVAQEVPAGLARSFEDCLLGVTPQGWMRSWDSTGLVTHSAWPVPPPLQDLPSNAVIVLSIEDIGENHALVNKYVELCPLVIVTQGKMDALLFDGSRRLEVPACHATVVDPTGAGDVFATGFFVRYHEAGDLREATRFAHATAALNIEGLGILGIPDRAAVEQRLAAGDAAPAMD